MAVNTTTAVMRRGLQIARELEWRPHPNEGAGVSLCYSKSDLDCNLCAYHKSYGCTQKVCCCAEERIAAGYTQEETESRCSQ